MPQRSYEMYITAAVDFICVGFFVLFRSCFVVFQRSLESCALFVVLLCKGCAHFADSSPGAVLLLLSLLGMTVKLEGRAIFNGSWSASGFFIQIETKKVTIKSHQLKQTFCFASTDNIYCFFSFNHLKTINFT